MWLLPYRKLQKILEKRFPRPAPAPGTPLQPEKRFTAKKMSAAVRAVSPYVPSATCLAQALTLRALLSREGLCSNLAIGVARDDESEITAHAWLEVDGTAVIGGEQRNNYTRLKMQDWE